MAVDIILHNDGIEISNELKILIDQIQVLFFTKPGDIMGYSDYGIDLKKYLFELNFSNYEMKKYINYQINRYIPYAKKFTINNEIRIFRGSFQDMAFVDIIINGTPVMGIHIK